MATVRFANRVNNPGENPASQWFGQSAESLLTLPETEIGQFLKLAQMVAGRLAHRVQLTTDGHKPYLTAVEDAFGSEIDYAMLVSGAGRRGAL
jgi:hypothetical protein